MPSGSAWPSGPSSGAWNACIRKTAHLLTARASWISSLRMVRQPRPRAAGLAASRKACSRLSGPLRTRREGVVWTLSGERVTTDRVRHPRRALGAQTRDRPLRAYDDHRHLHAGERQAEEEGRLLERRRAVRDDDAIDAIDAIRGRGSNGTTYGDPLARAQLLAALGRER
eukprot:5196170-Prymnesium_polylepis.1